MVTHTFNAGGPPATSVHLRYSPAKFKTTLFTAIFLTIMVTGLTWMVLIRSGNPDAIFWTALTSLVFFAFVSAPMLWRFYHREVVLAVRPTGLFDARISPEIIPWQAIKEVTIKQREEEFFLQVSLWPNADGAPNKFDIDLSPFDVSVRAITEAINEHVPVRVG